MSLLPHHSLQNLGIIPKHKLYLDPHIQDKFKYQNCHLQHLKHVSTTSQVFRGNLKTEIQLPLRFFCSYTYKKAGLQVYQDSCTYGADQAFQQLPYTPTAKYPAVAPF